VLKDLPESEIASQLRIHSGSVKQLKHRALTKLKEAASQ
jgi:DNA-directed RNA polymerase specialized sigma24 family protein